MTYEYTPASVRARWAVGIAVLSGSGAITMSVVIAEKYAGSVLTDLAHFANTVLHAGTVLTAHASYSSIVCSCSEKSFSIRSRATLSALYYWGYTLHSIAMSGP